MEIVPVTHDNVAYAVQLAKEMYGMSSFANDGPEFDWNETLGNFSRIMLLPSYYFRIALQDGDYHGAVLGHLTQFLFNRKMFALEDAWFVRPKTENRTKMGKMLMKGFMDWALIHDVWNIQSGDVASIESIAVQGLYNHLGFKRYGSIYVYKRETV